jgi:hypothetical protein
MIFGWLSYVSCASIYAHSSNDAQKNGMQINKPRDDENPKVKSKKNRGIREPKIQSSRMMKRKKYLPSP